MADELVLDLTNYKDTVGNYVSPGRYAVVVEDAELGASTQKKTPQLTLWLRIVGGEFDGSTIVEQLYLTEGSTFRVVGFLQALGIKTPRKKLQFKLQQFLNRRVYIVVEDDAYNGRTRSRVSGFERFVSAAGAETVDEMDGLDEVNANTEIDDLPEEAEVEAVAAPAAAPKSALVETAPAAAPVEVVVAAVDEDEDSEAIDLDALDL